MEDDGSWVTSDVAFTHIGKCTQKVIGYYVNDVGDYLYEIPGS